MKSQIIRYSIGFALFLIILFSFYFSKTALFLTSIFFIVLAMYEYRKMFKVKNIYPHKFLPEIIGTACSYIFIYSNNLENHHLITPILIFGFILSFIITIIENKKPYTLNTLTTLAAIIMIFCGLYIIKLTYYYEFPLSFYLILVYFISILISDFSANITGKYLKTPLLAKEISPNKTIGGSIIHIIICSIMYIILHKYLNIKISFCIMLGIVASIFAQFGDLAISCIKRDLDIKHSSYFFYEYGGVLDRMDAFIFSAPALYYCLFLVNII